MDKIATIDLREYLDLRERVAELEARNRLLEEMGAECAQDWQKIEKLVARIARLQRAIEFNLGRAESMAESSTDAVDRKIAGQMVAEFIAALAPPSSVDRTGKPT